MAIKRDFTTDKNAQKRLNAGKRSSRKNAGAPIDEVAAPNEEVVPPVTEEGGIAAEAKKEVEEAQAAVEEEKSETPAEEKAEGEEETGIAAEEKAESAEEKPVEGETAPVAAEEKPEEVANAPVEEVAPAEMPAKKSAPVGEYVPPKGESHDELLDKYHEALMMGDTEAAKDLYHKLREHRYQENLHRAKSEEQALSEAKAFEAATEEMIAAHPELGEDGEAADKVMALMDVYRNHGMDSEGALRKAVADLYPGEKAAPVEAEKPAEEVPPAAAAEEKSAEEAAPAAEEKPAEEEKMLPDMTERKLNKRTIANMPNATARKEAVPEKKPDTRSEAIAKMRAARGQ